MQEIMVRETDEDAPEAVSEDNPFPVALRKSNPITQVTTVAGLKDFRLGTQVGTTSYTYITDQIKPTKAPRAYDSLDAASEPFKVNNAKPALKKCLDLSVKYQYFDEFSRSCEVWLAKNYKAEYHVVDELRGAPTLSNSGLDEKGPPMNTDGTFWHPQAAAPEKTLVNEGEGATVLELSVADEDYGSVIGRGGRTASALRTLIKSVAARHIVRAGTAGIPSSAGARR